MEFQYYLKRKSEPPVTLAVYGRPLEGAEVVAFPAQLTVQVHHIMDRLGLGYWHLS